jgi:hypothetical protein
VMANDFAVFLYIIATLVLIFLVCFCIIFTVTDYKKGKWTSGGGQCCYYYCFEMQCCSEMECFCDLDE